jgi:exonuclease III
MEGQINELLLRIASYNCNSIRKSIDIVRHLLGNCDILVCQEIILLPEDIGLVQSIDNEFEVFVMPSKHANSNNFDGRPYGGSAIFWRIHHGINIYRGMFF